MNQEPKAVEDYLESVGNRETFLLFVRALIWDRQEASAREEQAPASQRGYGAFGWQNDSIESYFEAALRCVEAQTPQNDFLREPSWKAFAEFLYCGKIYE